ncbi:MAG: DNA mismatch repair protein MutS, partial [Muribaculaceae bacterium]|nr:DNA mismatch repair protein MutS [Muribaculaceae bacterium]
FGIHVAKLAGMPASIVRRADEVLAQLENGKGSSAPAGTSGGKKRGKATISPASQTATAGMQLSFFQLDDPVLSQVRDELLGVDINNLTPLEALTKLHDIRGILTGRHD